MNDTSIMPYDYTARTSPHFGTINYTQDSEGRYQGVYREYEVLTSKPHKNMYPCPTRAILKDLYYVNGVLNGKQTYYTVNGNTLLEENYTMGVLNGERITYRRNGSLYSREEFRDGVLQREYIYYMSGKLYRYHDIPLKRIIYRYDNPENTVLKVDYYTDNPRDIADSTTYASYK